MTVLTLFCFLFINLENRSEHGPVHGEIVEFVAYFFLKISVGTTDKLCNQLSNRTQSIFSIYRYRSL